MDATALLNTLSDGNKSGQAGPRVRKGLSANQPYHYCFEDSKVRPERPLKDNHEKDAFLQISIFLPENEETERNRSS